MKYLSTISQYIYGAWLSFYISIRFFILFSLLIISISGCVANSSSSIFESSKPIIDTKGVDMSQYSTDLEECSNFSEDISTGKPILLAGQLLSAGEIAVLATIQQSFVTVHRRPRVAIITTGDELVEIEEKLK